MAQNTTFECCAMPKIKTQISQKKKMIVDKTSDKNHMINAHETDICGSTKGP